MPRPLTISGALDHVLAVDPHRSAVVSESQSLSYAELDSAANAAAALFADLGVRSGDRLAAILPNDIDIVIAFHGAMRLGAIWLGINPALAPPEKNALLTAAGASVVLADGKDADDLSPARSGIRVLSVVRGADDDWSSGLTAHAGATRPAAPDPEQPAAIAFTSGTTGLPKGIVHSQRNLLMPAASLVASRGYDETLRKGDCLPLTILNLMILTTLLTSAAGGCCVLTDRRDARGIAEWIQREAVTVWNGVPALLHSMVRDAAIDSGALASMSEVWTGGADCPDDLFASFTARFGVPLRATYGLTEAPSVVAIDPVDGPHGIGASGIPLPHLDVIVRGDDGAVLPAGEQGEIAIRASSTGEWRSTYTPMLGVWSNDGIIRSDDHELLTGDLGWVDVAGRIVIRDRKKLLIIRGGANVYPAEVERVLAEFPRVCGAAVIGLPDDRLGQRVVAVVELLAGETTTADELVDYCRAQLARYKVPEQIVIVEELPRNSMGKVMRAALAVLFRTADCEPR